MIEPGLGFVVTGDSTEVFSSQTELVYIILLYICIYRNVIYIYHNVIYNTFLYDMVVGDLDMFALIQLWCSALSPLIVASLFSHGCHVVLASQQHHQVFIAISPTDRHLCFKFSNIP